MQSSFHEISSSRYIAEVKADDDVVSVSVPQNATGDVAGNKNLASNILQVRRRKKFIFLYILSVSYCMHCICLAGDFLESFWVFAYIYSEIYFQILCQ